MFGVFAIDEILRYRWTPFVGSRTLCHPDHRSWRSQQISTLHTNCYAIIIMIKIIIISIIDIIVTIITMIKPQRDTRLPGQEDRARGRDGGRLGCRTWKCYTLKIMLSLRRLSWKCEKLKMMLPFRRLHYVLIYNQLLRCCRSWKCSKLKIVLPLRRLHLFSSIISSYLIGARSLRE